MKNLAQARKKADLPSRDRKRENETLKRFKTKTLYNLTPEEAEFIWKMVLSISSEKQKGVAREGISLSRGKVDMVELRLDLFRGNLENIIPVGTIIIVTCKKGEGGAFGLRLQPISVGIKKIPIGPFILDQVTR